MKRALNNTELNMTDAEFGSCNECVLYNHSLELCVAAECFVDTVFFNSNYLSEYTHILGSKALKCKFCSLRHVLIGICVLLCRTGRIFD